MITSLETNDSYGIALEGLSDAFDRYARLLVAKGAAVQEGQELVIQASVETADFVHRLVKSAYEIGAGHVTVMWKDEILTRLEYENQPVEFFADLPSWKIDELNGLAEKGAAFLFLTGGNPEALKGIDPQKPVMSSRTVNTKCKRFRNGLDFGHNTWCIAGVPTRAWAKKIFPEASVSEAMYRLWQLILSTARADGDDPESTWETHNASFERTKRLLNEKQFVKLIYTSASGTDFSVELPEGHIWHGGCAHTQAGHRFFPNIPTEEVYTTPHRAKTNGTVYSALPLVYAGQEINNFWITFQDGKAVDCGAEVGLEVLQSIINTDENAGYLGEVALISKNTPIRQSQTIFYNTLYDENASCHLALGAGFPECLRGGEDLSKEELMKLGVNDSSTHVDFMIGTDDLNIVGIDAEGKEHQLFVNGQWEWE